MSGNTNPDKQGIFTQNLVGDFSALTARAQAVISALSSLSIGQLVSGASASSVLFVDSGLTLAQSPRFTYRESTNTFESLSDAFSEIVARFGADASAGAGAYNAYVEFLNGVYGRSGYIRTSDSSSHLGIGGLTRIFFELEFLGLVSYFGGSGDNESFYLFTRSATRVGQVIKLSALQTANAFEVQPDGSTTPIVSIRSNGAIMPATLADADAANNSIYYSSTASRLVYKDGAGVVNNLY